MKIPYFDHADLAYDEADNEISDPARAAQALASFLALTPSDRLADSRHIWAYYRDVHETIGGEEWLDPEMGVPAGPQDIWRHVRPRYLYINAGYEGDPACYIVVDCACDWEPEHGLMLVWRDGLRLTKAGGFDGHVSNEGAFDNPAYAGIVYASSSPQHVTRLDAP